MVAPVALLRTVKKEMRSRALVKSSTYSYAHKVTYPLQNFFNLELHRLFDKYLHIHLHKISQVHKNKWIYTCILKIHLHSVKFFFFFYILFLSFSTTRQFWSLRKVSALRNHLVSNATTYSKITIMQSWYSCITIFHVIFTTIYQEWGSNPVGHLSIGS